MTIPNTLSTASGCQIEAFLNDGGSFHVQTYNTVRALGRPKVGLKIEVPIRNHLSAGHGILKVAKIVGLGSGTVQRVKRETAASVA